MKYQHYDKNIKKNIPFEDKHDKMILVWDLGLWNGTNMQNHPNPTVKQINSNSSFGILVHHFKQNMKTNEDSRWGD